MGFGGFGRALLACTEKFMIFRGRAPQGEFWWFFVFVLTASVAASLAEQVVRTRMISVFVNVAFFLPLLAAMVRRLHDTNRGAIYLLIPFVPLPLLAYDPAMWGLGQLFALAVLGLILALPGQAGANRFGPDPRQTHDLEAFE